MTPIEEARAALDRVVELDPSSDLHIVIRDHHTSVLSAHEVELRSALRALIAEHERVLAHPLLATIDMEASTVIEVEEPTPPTDDEREAMLREARTRHPLDLDGWNRDRNHDKASGFCEGAEWAFRFHRQGPITYAQEIAQQKAP